MDISALRGHVCAYRREWGAVCFAYETYGTNGLLMSLTYTAAGKMGKKERLQFTDS